LTELFTAVLLRILELSHQALVTGVVTTKRFGHSLISFPCAGCASGTLLKAPSCGKFPWYTLSRAGFSGTFLVNAECNIIG
jgi:hypothetical protein